MLAALALAAVLVPDPKLTPGVWRTDLDTAAICTTKWGEDKRAVTEAMKLEVFHRYGYTGNDDPRCGTDRNGRHCEVDHRHTRELGGADVLENLWPQSYSGDWTASDKDRLENWAHRSYCVTHTLTLTQARAVFEAPDWRVEYVKAFGGPPEH